MNNDSTKTISRSAASFFSGTLISRISGMTRDIVMAAAFGSHPTVAAFMMAYRFSNLLRRLLGEGALQSAFIPHFEEIRHKNPEKGAAFFRNMTWTLVVILLSIIAITELGLIGGASIATISVESRDIITLTALMFPGVLFICLYGLNISLLQCEGKYFVASVAPAAFNIVWIGAVIWLRGTPPERAMPMLAAAVIVAFAAQWLATEPGTRKLVRNVPRGKPVIFSKNIVTMGKALSLGTLGVAAMQINSALDAIFARIADAEGPAYLWYAIRLQQLPVALFGVAIMGALLPPLSRAIKSGNIIAFRNFIDFGIRRNIALTIPCSVILIVSGATCVNILYGRGNFDHEATLNTSMCLWAYSTGLLPATCVMLLSSAFYATKNYRLPTMITLLSVALNIVLNTVFVFGMNLGTVSVALATSISSWVNAALLTYALASHHGATISSKTRITALKIATASIIAAIGVTYLQYLTPYTTIWPRLLCAKFPRTFAIQFLQCSTELATFAILLIIIARIMNIHKTLMTHHKM